VKKIIISILAKKTICSEVIKLKTLIKELPTYGILYERKIEGIKSPYCVRCYSNITQIYEIENWDHIWCCCENETTETEIIYRTLEELEDQYKGEDAKMYIILRKLNLEITKFLTGISRIFKGFKRIREVTRGLVNRNLHNIGVTKEERKLIDIIFEKIYFNIRNFIWLKRCDMVIEWEKSQNIKNSSKRNYKEAVLNDQNINNQNENRKNNKNSKT
jgi:hypothetical protein